MKAETEQLLSAEEFMARLNEFWPAELIAGRVVRSTKEEWEMSNGGVHGRVRNKVGFILERFLEQNPVGHVFQETGVQTKEAQVRFPDLCFFSNEQIPKEGIPTGNFSSAPDLAVEVVSPSDTYRELMARVDEYLAAGTKSVWLVDPDRARVTLFRPGPKSQLFSAGDTLQDDPSLPGLQVEVARLFEGLPRPSGG